MSLICLFVTRKLESALGGLSQNGRTQNEKGKIDALLWTRFKVPQDCGSLSNSNWNTWKILYSRVCSWWPAFREMARVRFAGSMHRVHLRITSLRISLVCTAWYLNNYDVFQIWSFHNTYILLSSCHPVAILPILLIPSCHSAVSRHLNLSMVWNTPITPGAQ